MREMLKRQEESLRLCREVIVSGNGLLILIDFYPVYSNR